MIRRMESMGDRFCSCIAFDRIRVNARGLSEGQLLPSEETPAELWLPSPQVWIKSERLDLHDERRFVLGRCDWRARLLTGWSG